jgi:hypothetical protein
MTCWDPPSTDGRYVAAGALDGERLALEVSRAYERLVATRRGLWLAAEELSGYERRAQVENAETLLEAKNERTMGIYLDGILDTPEHAGLLAAKNRAELEHFEARAEVQRLELMVRLLEATGGTEQDPTPG